MTAEQITATPQEATIPVWRGRWLLYLLGVAAVAYGGYELLVTAGKTHPPAAAIWFAGGVVAHDAVFVPVVLLGAAAVVRFVPRVARPVVQSALFVSGSVFLVALPLVWGLGGNAGNPSTNPLPYGRNLAIVLAVVWAVAAVLVVRRVLRARRSVHHEHTASGTSPSAVTP